MAYEIGSAYIQIVPSFKGVAQAIEDEARKWGVSAGEAFGNTFSDAVKAALVGLLNEDEEALKKGESAGSRFADAFRARVDAALRSLPDADIGLNSSGFDIDLAKIRSELETLRSQRIGIDISDTDALAKLAALKLALVEIGRSSKSIDIKVNTAAAVTEITAFEGTVKSAGDLLNNPGGFAGAGGALDTLGADAASASFSVGDLLVPALAALVLALIPIAGLAGGALTALPALVGGLGLGLGAVTLGFSGVLPAIQAYRATLNTAGETAAQVKTKQDALVNSLAGLTPAGRTFVTFVGSELLPVFDNLKTAVQGALLPGITTGLQAMLPFFQALGPLITAAATGIGQTFSELGKFIGSSKGLSEINTILSDGNGLMSKLGDAAVTLFKAFTSIGSQASPIVKAIGDGIQHLVDAFAKWAEGGGFQKFLQWLKDNGPAIVSDIGNVAKAIGKLIVDLTPAGKFVLDLAGAFGRLVSDVSDAIRILTDFISNSLSPLIGAINRVAGAIEYVGSHWHQAWTDIKNWADDAYHHIRSAVFDPIANFFTVDLPGALSTAVGFFTRLPGEIGSALSGLFSTISGAFGDVASWVNTNVIQPVISFFKGMPSTIAKDLKNFVSDIFSDIGDVADWVDKHIVQPIVHAIQNIPKDIGKIGSGILGDITGGLGSLVGAIPGLAAGGIVTRPTVALVGEAGPEAVVPLSLLSAGIPSMPTPFALTFPQLGVASGAGGVAMNIYGGQHIHQDVDVQAVGQQLAFLSRGRRL